jgi:hypothetical protein
MTWYVNATDEAAKEHSDDLGQAQLVTGTKKKWRSEMTDPALGKWDVTTTGGLATPVPAAGVLAVALGTVAGAGFSMISKEIFTVPSLVNVGFRLSQKIANNEFYIELVKWTPTNPLTPFDGFGTVDETCVAAWRVAGTDTTSVTIARSEVNNGQAGRTQSGNITTVTHSGSDATFSLRLESDEVWFTSRTPNSTGSQSAAAGVSQLVVPDPNAYYKIRIRALNNGVPATNTTVTIYYAQAIDLTEVNVTVQGGDGSQAPGQALPVSLINTPTVSSAATVSSTVTSGSLSRVKSAATTNATNLKATSGRVYGIIVSNTSAAIKYLKFYNKATAPTVGTDTPVLTIAIPVGGQPVQLAFPNPLPFATGIGYAITGAVADADTTATAVDDVTGAILWV